ncbi:MAG TPA: serine/threonine-protein kinase [Polyangiaceae bacterium]|jgi:serine/threonine-protein kinase
MCPIAEGGMASVWVARLRSGHEFEKVVAIKTILPKFAGDERFRSMFADEARIAARIDHPNVAQVFDLGEDRGLLYIVMEYIDGDSLAKLNRACQKEDTRIPAGVVLRVLSDACAGLHEAHELRGEGGKPLGIVHRDISPHNVLCTARGLVKLIDFGIAKTGSPEGAPAESGTLKGKIQYMAPEQALGRPVDRRADLWAVGAILYSVLAGKAPYEGDSQLAMLHLLGSGVPPQPLPPEVHPAVAAVARKALALDPAKRYATAADLRDAMERAMVMAQLATTAADVAAFSSRHLAERIQRRHDAIDRAFEASSKRGAGDEPNAWVAGQGSPDATGGSLPPVRPGSERAGVAAQASEPPAAGASYASLGPAALAAAPSAFPSRARRVVTYGVGIGVAAGLAVSFGPSLGERARIATGTIAAAAPARIADDPPPSTPSDVEPAVLAPVPTPPPAPSASAAAPDGGAHPKKAKKTRPDANPY